MGPRPAHLGLDGDGGGDGPLRPPNADWQLDLHSPHIGEVPPALSPLDAFACRRDYWRNNLNRSSRMDDGSADCRP